MVFAKNKKRYFKRLSLAIVLLLFIKIYFFNFYFSYENEDLGNNDNLNFIVNKSVIGARIPLNFKCQNCSNYLYNLYYFRLPGLYHLKTNDQILYNSPKEHDPPIHKKKQKIARVIGLPGDTVEIIKKQVNANGKVIAGIQKLTFIYRVTTDGTSIASFVHGPRYIVIRKFKGINVYDLEMTRDMAAKLLDNEHIKYVREIFKEQRQLDYQLFPYNILYTWNTDYYGPVIVPQKGDIIHLDIITYPLYKQIIEIIEKNQVEIINNDFYINHIKSSFYKIKQDYYFVLSDRRDTGSDSRNFGFLPKNHIIGKIGIQF